jgi:hypothetical protein
MFNYKYLTILMACVVLYSCNPAKMIVAFNESMIDEPMFTEVINGADSILVYKTAFIEKYVDNNGVLEFCMLNKKDTTTPFRYLKMMGDNQDVYLVRIMKNKRDSFIFFSARSSMFPEKVNGAVRHCKGFGPAYFGSYDQNYKLINFSKTLKIDKDGDMHRKKKSSAKPIFILTGALSKNRSEDIGINKIMFGEANKFGGKRPVVMSSTILSKDSTVLSFSYLKTIKTGN